jgi:hypothetical protein
VGNNTVLSEMGHMIGICIFTPKKSIGYNKNPINDFYLSD